ELFTALALLYFAASSFAEAARRLGRPDLPGSFLSGDHPAFGAALRFCCRAVLAWEARDGAARERLIAHIEKAIEPFDVAGLLDHGRRNWHPVEAEPLRAGALKLNASRGEVEAMLERTGFLGSVGDSQPSALRSGRVGRRATQGEADDLRRSGELGSRIVSIP
ncbi:MAG TPA: hypothetical protein VK780_00315, partial [Thermoanaerobaculia bacterium]|nr:hypothetical protein [Thermoanaerobaculia bacterium]